MCILHQFSTSLCPVSWSFVSRTTLHLWGCMCFLVLLLRNWVMWTALAPPTLTVCLVRVHCALWGVSVLAWLQLGHGDHKGLTGVGIGGQVTQVFVNVLICQPKGLHLIPDGADIHAQGRWGLRQCYPRGFSWPCHFILWSHRVLSSLLSGCSRACNSATAFWSNLSCPSGNSSCLISPWS